MRRLVLISGEPDTPGHLYRVERRAAAAARLGIASSWMPVGQIGERLEEIAAADWLIVWRAGFSPEIGLAINRARQAGVPVLFDIDDLVIDPRLARGEVIDAIRFNRYPEDAVRQLYAAMQASLDAADAGICTTEELALHLRVRERPVFVLENGFDDECLWASRRAVRRRERPGHSPGNLGRCEPALAAPDGKLRIGYAGGTRTHQQDFEPAAAALARLLAEQPNCRLVLFRDRVSGLALVDIGEFPELQACAAQIEWREMVPLAELAEEIARFDINLAPLSVGNPFCEAKSELKYFEAALVEVTTVASPTGPFRRAIRDGETGLLANTADEWYAALGRLAADAGLRRRLARAAFHDVLWRFGPEAQAERLHSVLAQAGGGRAAAAAFEQLLHRHKSPRPELPQVPAFDILYYRDTGLQARVTVIVPVYNYAHYVIEALDSVRAQTEPVLDLVVIDDGSTDRSLAVVRDWAERHAERFNRLLVLRNEVNCGLGLTRNAGFSAAETPFVLPLDADNRLLPNCVAACADAISPTGAGFGAAYAYPAIQQFGDAGNIISNGAYWPARFAGGNFIDAMALVAKPAWARAGGYQHVNFGWEDYDFWCCLAEAGLWGHRIAEVHAEYRVHGHSMLRTVTEIADNKTRLLDDIQRRHSWLAVRGVQRMQEWIDLRYNDTADPAAADDGPSEVSAGPLLLVDGVEHQPLRPSPNRLSFVLSRPAVRVQLVSGTHVPARLDAGVTDRRRLGISVRRILCHRADGLEVVMVDHPDLRDGWWECETQGGAMWRWTTGAAWIPIPRDTWMLEIDL